jgi:hypothetical protein
MVNVVFFCNRFRNCFILTLYWFMIWGLKPLFYQLKANWLIWKQTTQQRYYWRGSSSWSCLCTFSRWETIKTKMDVTSIYFQTFVDKWKMVNNLTWKIRINRSNQIFDRHLNCSFYYYYYYLYLFFCCFLVVCLFVRLFCCLFCF